jgi:hypothetical protein
LKYYQKLHPIALAICNLAVGMFLGINFMSERMIGALTAWNTFEGIYVAGAIAWIGMWLIASRFAEQNWHPLAWVQAATAFGGLAVAIWWIRSLNQDISTPIPGLIGLVVVCMSPYALPPPPPNTWYHRLLTYLDNEMLKQPENYQGRGW